MNTRRKGNKTVRNCKEFFESYGFLVDDCEKKGRFLKQKDLYGLFDCVAIRASPAGTEVAFIQSTCNRPHKHKPYTEFAKIYATHMIAIYQFIWIDRKGVKLVEYSRSGKKSTTNWFGKDRNLKLMGVYPQDHLKLKGGNDKSITFKGEPAKKGDYIMIDMDAKIARLATPEETKKQSTVLTLGEGK